MFKEIKDGSTHYVGDGCNPPHLPIGDNYIPMWNVPINRCLCGAVEFVGSPLSVEEPAVHSTQGCFSSKQTTQEILQLFQDYADRNEDENVRLAILKIKEELKK